MFDALGNQSMPLDALAGRIGLSPVACRRLLMVLVTSTSSNATATGFATPSWTTVLDLVRCRTWSDCEGQSLLSHVRSTYQRPPRVPARDGSRRLAPLQQDAFATLYADPVRLREFAELMNAISVPQGRLIAEAFDFAPHRCIMDVAGGPGGQSIEIGLTPAHLRGIVMDMEPVRGGPRADGRQRTVRPLHGDRRRLDDRPLSVRCGCHSARAYPPRLE